MTQQKQYGESVLVSTVKKNSIDELRISIDEYNGYKYVSVRTWTEKSDSKEKIATRNGVTLPFRTLGEIIDTLKRIESSAKKRGYL